MTCVVGVADPGKGAVVGFDSLAAGGWDATVRADLKGAQLFPWLAFGYTTSYRFGQILAHHLTLEDDQPADPYDWAVRSFVPAARTALKEHGWLKKENEREEAGDVLLAVRDRVFIVHSDFQVGESAAGYDAVGCGDQAARGAIHVIRAVGSLGPKATAQKALQAASDLSAGVSPPFHYFTTRA